MNVRPKEDRLTLTFSGSDALYAFARNIHIERSKIITIQLKEEFSIWRKIHFRAPGSFIPGVIMAGSYYSPEGWDFIFVHKPSGWVRPTLKDVLVIQTSQHRYNRIILDGGSEEAEVIIAWANQKGE